MAGLFFCLASAEGAGLLFCSVAIQTHTIVYSTFCAVNASYTTHATKQRTGLCMGFSCDLPHSTAANNRPTQAAIIPPAQRWSVSQRRNASSAYQNHRHARTLYSSAQTPYYNKVYKGAAVRTYCCRSMLARRGLDASHAQRLAIWHRSAVRAHRLAPSTRRVSPAAGARRATRNRWRLSPHLFSGFRPIANRGQQ